MLERDGGIVLGDFGNGGAPELRDFEDVGFVDGGDFLAALGGEFKGYAGDADDLGLGVAHGVDGFSGFLVPPAGRAEVEAAEELANKEDVSVLDDFGAEGRVFRERRVGDAKGAGWRSRRGPGGSGAGRLRGACPGGGR